jgi:hypothetical protein
LRHSFAVAVFRPVSHDVAIEEQMSITDEKRNFTVAQFCAAYGIGLTKTYEEINSGRLAAVKAGTRTLIPVESAEAWRRSLPAVRPAVAA